jgi:hypothetical protein
MPDSQDNAYLFDDVRELVMAGYLSLKEIQDMIFEECEGEAHELMIEELQDFAESAMEERLEKEKTCSTQTNDAIDAAFAELTDAGILAVQNIANTLDDAWLDVNEIVEQFQESGQEIIGAVFFHGQDTVRALKGEGLMLTFGEYHDGSEEECEAASLVVARKAVEALQRHGVSVSWAGSEAERIVIAPFLWCRNRTNKDPIFGSGR